MVDKQPDCLRPQALILLLRDEMNPYIMVSLVIVLQCNPFNG